MSLEDDIKYTEWASLRPSDRGPTAQAVIRRALMNWWGYRPDDGTELTRAYNAEVSKVRLAYERQALGLTDDQEQP